MRAVDYFEPGLPITHEDALRDLDVPDPPAPGGRDLLARVHAVSVNPRDVKSRQVFKVTPDRPVILGYDASGIVEAVGPEAALFRPGDPVFYAGVPNRPGSNAELQLVDERIVGRKPASLDHATAASLPLTALTAYEMLFDRLGVPLHEVALAVLPGNAMALDMYAWLAQRLHRLDPAKPVLVPWPALRMQFGWHYDRLDNFRPVFRRTLSLVASQYRGARVDLDRRGMMLSHSQTPVKGRTAIAVRKG